jgi:hypothetical protein
MVRQLITRFKTWALRQRQQVQDKALGWTKPDSTGVVVGALADLHRRKTDSMLENALLRQQLMVLKRQVKRPALSERVGSAAARVAGEPSADLEADRVDCPARDDLTLASRPIPMAVAAQVEAEGTPAAVVGGAGRAHQAVGSREPVMGCRADPRRTAQAWYPD